MPKETDPWDDIEREHDAIVSLGKELLDMLSRDEPEPLSFIRWRLSHKGGLLWGTFYVLPSFFTLLAVAFLPIGDPVIKGLGLIDSIAGMLLGAVILALSE